MRPLTVSRRLLLQTTLAGLGAAACGRPQERVGQPSAHPGPSSPSDAPLPPTPRLCTATEDNIEGPFFTPGAPRRTVLAGADTPGIKLSLTGRALRTDCSPLPGAILEVWHADHTGAYDNEGFGFRGTLECDREGGFALDTIIPGHYLNGDRYRPAHIHLKIAAAGHRPLTTQLYFEGDPYNEGDPFIRRSLIMALRDTPVGKAAAHDIVLL